MSSERRPRERGRLAVTILGGVGGTVDQVEEKLVSASRGAMMELARLVVASGGSTIAINPAHVVALRERQ